MRKTRIESDRSEGEKGGKEDNEGGERISSSVPSMQPHEHRAIDSRIGMLAFLVGDLRKVRSTRAGL